MLYKITPMNKVEVIYSESYTDDPIIRDMIAKHYKENLGYEKVIIRNTDTNTWTEYK